LEESALTTPQRPLVDIGSKNLSAQIDPLGAQLSSLKDQAGRDLLWNGDPAVWAGRSPLLFPIVGMLCGGRYLLGGKSFELSRHGFARGSEFKLEEATSSRATFSLAADAASRNRYPFEFSLVVDYQVDGAALWIRVQVKNLGHIPMPASFGFHPGFRWPLPFGEPRDAHVVEFAMDEPAPVRRLNAQGLLSPQPEPTPVRGRQLALRDELFVNDVLIFDRLKSTQVTYGAAKGPRLRVSFPDTPYFGIWTKPDAPFVCLEPWHGISDPEDFKGEFSAKPGIFSVAPGASKTIGMTIEII
jgi:galactose mutarotase-like enzyme